MKTLEFDFKLWPNDEVYYIKEGQVRRTYVGKVTLEYATETPISKEYTTIKYHLRDVGAITDADINTIYFIDKKKLIQHLVAQL